ncbi:MAG: PD40 domain-containing protein [Candidatus Eremiobacteraeota bacterium]|nr:PD40 domain-containing protein [Candidatus Eremiobacteraeota bacterium]
MLSSRQFLLPMVGLSLVIWTSLVSAGPLSERLLFVSEPLGIPKIYSVRPDGLEVRRLTGRRHGPEWEPELHGPTGRVVFRSRIDGNDEIFSVDSRGRQERRLTDHPARDLQPSWSPDGSRVVFATDRWGAFELAALDLENSRLERLTFDQAGSSQPRWSPDGRQIAFVSRRHGNSSLYLLRLEDKSFQRLTFDHRSAVWPRWSPQGDRIVYQGQKGGRNRPCIRIVEIHSGIDYEVAAEAEGPRYPSWSPDGSQLLMSAGPPENRSLFRFEVESGELTPLALRGSLPPSETDWAKVPLPWSSPEPLEKALEAPVPTE